MEYKLANSSEWIHAEVNLTEYRSPISEYTQRNIFTALLKDLKSSSVYYFRIKEPSFSDKEQEVYSYTTFNSNQMTIVAGGDIGNTELTLQMTKNTMKHIPFDLVIAGGDIAYDNNVATCYQTWDYLVQNLLLNRYDRETGTIRVIPVIFGFGNHDLGVNSYSDAVIQNDSNSPVIKHYYPQNTVNGRIPKIEERKSYFYQKISENMLIISPDVGYETPMEGEQTEWMENLLKEFTSNCHSSVTCKNPLIIVQYHGPILTACEQEKAPDQIVIENGLKYWFPLFDKYNVTIVSENHTHAMKRSKRVKFGKENPSGTYYIGEGNWGVSKDSGY